MKTEFMASRELSENELTSFSILSMKNARVMIMKNDLGVFGHKLSWRKAALCMKFLDELNMQSLVNSVMSALARAATRK